MPASSVPRWAAVAAWTAVAAAVPTVLWRALIGFGVELGTPDAWRAEQGIPGSGTAYVLTLSALQLLAAVLVLCLVRPAGDVVPRWSPIRAGHRLPAVLVAVIALGGAVALAIVCALSIINWSAVDPFAGQPSSGWSRLCHGCYLATLLWPPALATTVIGYAINRRRTRPDHM